MADNSFWSQLRRSGKLGTGQERFQHAEDAKDMRPIFPRDLVHSPKEEQALRKLVEDSHAEHKAVTGQTPAEPTPEEQGYTTYRRK